MRTSAIILLLIFSLSGFCQFNDKPVKDNIELVGQAATIDRVNGVFIVTIDDAIYKASGLEQALNMVYQTKIRSYDDYSFADQKWGLMVRVTVDDGGWDIEYGQDKYHTDSFLESKKVIYELFADAMKGGLLFNFTNEKYKSIK